MIYVEQLDLGRNKECLVDITVVEGKVSARMFFYINGTNTYNITIRKNTDDKVIVPHCTFPDYVKKVLDVLSELVLPSVYYKEVILK